MAIFAGSAIRVLGVCLDEGPSSLWAVGSGADNHGSLTDSELAYPSDVAPEWPYFHPATAGGSEGIRESEKIGKRTSMVPAMEGGSSIGFLRHDCFPLAALAIPAPGFCTPQAYRRLENRGRRRYHRRAIRFGTLVASRGSA